MKSEERILPTNYCLFLAQPYQLKHLKNMPLESSSLFCFMDSLAMPTIIFKHIESNQGLFKNIIHVRCQEGLKLLWIELLSIYLSQIIIITEESSKVGGWRVCVCVCVCGCTWKPTCIFKPLSNYHKKASKMTLCIASVHLQTTQ